MGPWGLVETKRGLPGGLVTNGPKIPEPLHPLDVWETSITHLTVGRGGNRNQHEIPIHCQCTHTRDHESVCPNSLLRCLGWHWMRDFPRAPTATRAVLPGASLCPQLSPDTTMCPQQHSHAPRCSPASQHVGESTPALRGNPGGEGIGRRGRGMR